MQVQFSDGQYNLWLEFYAGGNIILTDREYNILALLRTVTEGTEGEQFRVGIQYDLKLRQNYNGIPELTKERIAAGLKAANDLLVENEKNAKKFKRKSGDALRRALATSITEYPPILLDHVLDQARFDKSVSLNEVLEKEELLDSLLKALGNAKTLIAEITSTVPVKGYIIAKRNKAVADDGEKHVYEDVHPFKPLQYIDDTNVRIIEIEGYNKTIDNFFSSVEGQRLEQKLEERELAAKRKLENARSEHENKIGGLQQLQDQNEQKAQAIEANHERIEEARAAVNSLLAQGMDWEDVGVLIEREQSRGNPVALSIKLPLKLGENTITLLLSDYSTVEDDDTMDDESASEPSDSEDEGTKSRKPSIKAVNDTRIAIDIDLSQTAWANARQYHDQRRNAASKQDRTVQVSAKVLKNAEARITADLKKGLKQEKDILRPVRKQFWFEKFFWFVSSEGYLVLSGKDAQQSDLIYRRHLKKGDLFVHADLKNAMPVFIKNNSSISDSPIPPSTLSQAGTFCVCSSSAWDSKAVMSAWWVKTEQVSKIASTGDFLGVGEFNVKGGKNFLPPSQLLLGFAIVFQVDDDSKARHMKHRLIHPDPDNEGEEDTKTPLKEEATESDHGFNDNDSDDDEFPDAGKDDDERSEVAESVEHKEISKSEQDIDTDEHEDHDDHSTHRDNPLQPGKHSDHDHTSDAETADESSIIDEGGSVAENDSIAATQNQTITNSVKSSVSTKSSQQLPIQSKSNTAAPKQQVRGKRGKSKKIATKYADQDEDDRQLAMSLLHSAGPASNMQHDHHHDHNADSNVKLDKPITQQETLEQARIRRSEQHNKTQEAGIKAEKLRQQALASSSTSVSHQTKKDEDDDDADEESNESALDSPDILTQILQSLIGTPHSEDNLLEAIPMCAPWTALTKYKHKVKLQPGTVKKGKAMREILSRWNKGFEDLKKRGEHHASSRKSLATTVGGDIARNESNPEHAPLTDIENESVKQSLEIREADLVRAWKETEVQGVVPVKSVRVIISGGANGAGDGGKGKGKSGGSGKRGGRGSKKAR